MDNTGFDFADLVDEVVSRAGGETATAADILKIRRGWRILTERWMAQGYNTWRIKTMQLGIAGDFPEVRLPNCVDDVVQINSINGDSRSETGMRRISASEYAQLTDKGTRGQPTQYWLQRTEPPVLHIFPIGQSNRQDGLTITYVERPEDYETYEAGDDVPGRWLEALTIGLALDLAKKRPPLNEGLIARLSGEAMQAEALAQANDRDRANYRYRI